MTWEDLRVRWHESSAHALRRWSRLTARDLRVIAGNRERLIGILQQRYGAHRRIVEREVRAFTRAPAASVSGSTRPSTKLPP